MEQLVHTAHGSDVPRQHGQRLPVPRVRRPAGLGVGVRRQPFERRDDHVPRLASGQHPGIRHRRSRPARSRHGLRQRAYRRHAATTGRPARRSNVGPDMGPRGGPFNRDVRTMPILWSPVDPDLLFYTSNVGLEDPRSRPHVDAHQPRPGAPDLGRARRAPASTPRASSQPRWARSRRCRRRRSTSSVLWAGTDDGNIQVTNDGGGTWTNVTPPAIKPWTRIFNIEAGHFDRGTAYAAANTMRIDDMNPHFWRTHDGGAHVDRDQHGSRAGRRRQLDPRRPPPAGAALRRHRNAGVGLVRRRRPLAVAAARHAGRVGARHPGEGRRHVPVLGSRGRHPRPRASGSWTT